MKKFILFVLLMALAPVSALGQTRSVRTITVTNCVDGAQLVANAVVTASGERTEVTSFTGETRINVSRETPITFEAIGYETYYTVAGDDTRFCLAPDQDDDFILNLFHRGATTERILLLGLPGKGPAKEVFVVPDDEYKYGVARENVEKGFRLLTEATAHMQVFTVVDQVPVTAISPVVTRIKTNPDKTYAMGTVQRYYGQDGYSMTGCDVLIRDPEYASDRLAYALIAHEGGHCFGMGHAGNGIMGVGRNFEILTFDFNGDEMVAMRVALTRGQGHQFRDRDKRLPPQ